VIEVVAAGPLTSVQDAVGRRGWRHLGVPVGGAADPWSARLANVLVGNDELAGVLEVTVGGLVLRSDDARAVAVTGGTTATVGGLPAASHTALRLRAGEQLSVEPGAGLRGYVAVAGGIDVESVLGSRATDLRSGFGGLDGRALHDGDRLAVGRPSAVHRRWTGTWGDGPIRIVAGPHGAAAVLEGEWTVGGEADRTGVRLDGARLEGGEIASMGLPLGAIQVPPDGRPIVMLADRPVTGGYGVPACVIGAEIGRVAQLRPGDRLTLTSVPMEEAREAMRQAERELAALETLDANRDDELGWAGSHR
jgi:biotin-dependent carboxylase-like uncharacterized protein